MILIGENINILSKTAGPAIKERNTQQIQDIARAAAQNGMDYLDINIGPAARDGAELMLWLVRTVQAAVDLPLSLDTTNIAAVEAGLKVHRGRALINSITLARMDDELPVAKRYNANFVGLLWGREGMPRDADERSLIATELVAQANAVGIPSENIWLDPIVTPVSNVDTNQVKPCLEFMSVLNDIAPGCKSIIGLSNVSNGVPRPVRIYPNRTYLMMLMKYGISAAIVDAFDAELIQIARGKRPELVGLVHRIMDGVHPDPGTLTEEETKYAKTIRVLLGEVLYSHSWLDI
jgi:5-methyltetrahydrofolate corrinoid/iron sulfur protein methyltransferase